MARDGGVIAGGRLISWRRLVEQAESLNTATQPDVAGASQSNAVTILSAMIAGVFRGCGVTVAPLPNGDVSVKLHWHGRERNSLGIYTSGSTGTPKLIRWQWTDLLNLSIGTARMTGSTMWSGYGLSSYAGVQVFIAALMYAHILHVGSSLYAAVCSSPSIDLAMAPPTMWRRLIAFEDMKRYCGYIIRTISMGSEPADQTLLDALSYFFPSTRIVQVYAATEVGSLFTVSDRMEGFPITLLCRQLSSGARVSIREGELVVRRRGADWPTGDLVEIVGNRVLFRGRKALTIKVAGRTVSPLKVECSLRKVTGVADIKVYGIPNTMSGSLLVCDVVLAQNADPTQVEAKLRIQARAVLNPEEAPRRFHFVDSLAMTPSGKARSWNTNLANTLNDSRL